MNKLKGLTGGQEGGEGNPLKFMMYIHKHVNVKHGKEGAGWEWGRNWVRDKKLYTCMPPPSCTPARCKPTIHQ